MLTSSRSGICSGGSWKFKPNEKEITSNIKAPIAHLIPVINTISLFLLRSLLKLVSKLQKNAAPTTRRFPYRLGFRDKSWKLLVLKEMVPSIIKKNATKSYLFTLSFKKNIPMIIMKSISLLDSKAALTAVIWLKP